MTPTTTPTVAVDNIQSAINAGQALGTPHTLGEQGSVKLMGIVVPAGSRLEQVNVDLEKFQLAPNRKKGNVTLTTAASFIDWVNRNKTPETVIYAKEFSTDFKAIFNGHAANVQPAPPVADGSSSSGADGAPGWGDFTATYDCPLSEEWMRWHGNSQHAASVDAKRGMKHADFIQFIEDNLLDITLPASGAMLAAVRSFEAKKDVKFASARRLENGDVQFAYAENTEQQTPAGSLALPSQFEVTIPVFRGGAPYVIAANLRYRVSAGGLMLWYELVRPHKSLEHAFEAVRAEIEDGTSVPMFAT
jgi:uncharacterized protein YfdQ (DUF2303 family)